MANRLPSGRWRGRVRDPRNGKQVAPHTIIGGAKTYPTERQAERAEDAARDVLLDLAERGKTVGEWWQEWTTDPLWARGESTNLHYAERIRAFAQRYGDRPLRSIDSLVVAEWLKGGENVGTVPTLCTMFNDARRPHAGMLIDANPFAGLRLKRSKGRKHVQPPAPGEVARLIAAADDLCPPSFAGYLFCACYTAMRPGEIDALRWEDLDFTPGGRVHRRGASVEREDGEDHQPEARFVRDDRHGRAAARPPARPAARIGVGLHDPTRPPLRAEHAQPPLEPRPRGVGLGNTALYEATRHYFAWYLLNVAELPDHVVAAQLRHDDGGSLVRELYGHPDAAIARERIRAAFRTAAPVVAFPPTNHAGRAA